MRSRDFLLGVGAPRQPVRQRTWQCIRIARWNVKPIQSHELVSTQRRPILCIERSDRVRLSRKVTPSQFAREITDPEKMWS